MNKTKRVDELEPTKMLKDEFLFLVQSDKRSYKVSLKEIAKFMQEELKIQFTCKGCGVVIRDIKKGCDHCGR